MYLTKTKLRLQFLLTKDMIDLKIFHLDMTNNFSEKIKQDQVTFLNHHPWKSSVRVSSRLFCIFQRKENLVF